MRRLEPIYTPPADEVSRWVWFADLFGGILVLVSMVAFFWWALVLTITPDRVPQPSTEVIADR